MIEYLKFNFIYSNRRTKIKNSFKIMRKSNVESSPSNMDVIKLEKLITDKKNQINLEKQKVNELIEIINQESLVAEKEADIVA